MLVLLYVHDSLRFDFTGCYNPSEPNTPNLDAFAKDGVIFERSYAQTTWTKASGASMLTSIYPQGLGVEHQWTKVPPDSFMLLDALREHGFTSVGLSTNSFISKRFGFDAGFDEIPDLFERNQFKDRPRRPLAPSSRTNRRLGNPYVTSQDLNELFLPWLRKAPDSLLGVLWSMDTHLPYFDRNRLGEHDEGLLVITKDKISSTPRSILLDLYRGMIQFSDGYFGELILELKARGHYEESMIIVVGDHGESFGERGQFTHSGIPFEEQIRVPLIIKLPNREHAGTRYPGTVELADIMPTILEVAGVSFHDPRIRGRSLIPLLEGDTSSRNWAYSSMNTTASSLGTTSLVTKEWQYILQEAPQPRITLGQVGGVRSFLKWCVARFIHPILYPKRKLLALSRGGKLLHVPTLRPAYRNKMQVFEKRMFEIMDGNIKTRKSWSHSGEEAKLDARVVSRLADLGYLE
jgi:arylsulfatase A-like enzyme